MTLPGAVLRRGRRDAPRAPGRDRKVTRDPAHRAPGPALGPRPRPGRAAAARRRGRAAEGPVDWQRPHPGARARARRDGLRRHARRRDRGHRVAGTANAAGATRRCWWRIDVGYRRAARPARRPRRTSAARPSSAPTARGWLCVRERTWSTPTSPHGHASRRRAAGRRRRPAEVGAGLGPLAGGALLDAPTAPRWSSRPTSTAAARCSGSTLGVRRRRVTRLTGDDGAYTDLGRRPRRAPRVRAAQRRRRPARPGPAGRDGARPASRCRCRAGRRARAARHGSPRWHATAADGTPLRAWLVAAAATTEPRPRAAAAAAVGPRRAAGQLERLAVAVEPVADGRARVRRAAARPGAVHRLRRWTSSTRGWGAWGDAPYTDLMALTDAAQRPARTSTPTRTAAMGGSFGGYMANWIAGHTDRFRAIVTHASLWALDQFGAHHRQPRLLAPGDDPRAGRCSTAPHRHADAIRTPMLVIHGDRDYRVPIGEALRAVVGPGRAARRRPRPIFRTGSCTSPTRTTGSSRPSTP